MTGIEIFQTWLIAFFTLALFSFMYKDNPIYKVAEHIFAGLTAGYQVGLVWDTVILQKLWDPMVGGQWWLFIPGILGFLMFARFWEKFSWVSRVSLAFVMGVTAGIFLISQLHGLVLPQMQSTMIAASERVDGSADDFYFNQRALVLVDSDSTATKPAAAVDLPAQPAAADSVSSADSLPVSEALTDTVPPLVEPPVFEAFPLALLGSTSSDRDSVLIEGTDSVTLRAEFTDTSALSFGEFYALTFRIKPAEGPPLDIVESKVYADNGILLEETAPGSFTAEYRFNPPDTVEAGVYHLGFKVERRSVMFLLTIIIVVGVVSTLIYFYFSKEHTGALGVAAKVGIWFIMISFGAHFGYTVMGRVSLLIGRVQFLIEDWIGSFL